MADVMVTSWCRTSWCSSFGIEAVVDTREWVKMGFWERVGRQNTIGS
jgi:hypothetical protein